MPTVRRKVFRDIQGIPLDGNAKARIWTYAKAYNAKHRRDGQHQGPITWAFFRVLRALLWGFHNNRTGHCFPSYEAIAEKAECHRDTVYEAINTLSASDILDWEQR
ncbi:MAG: helix-turn-helix domain-containing protein, partial [Terriglobia bacterium]